MQDVFSYFTASTVFFAEYQKSHNTKTVLLITWSMKLKMHNPEETFSSEKST